MILGMAFYRGLRANPFAPSESSPASPEPAPSIASGDAANPGAISAEGWQPPAPRPGVDASNFYKNAFVLYAALTKEEEKMLFQQRDEMDAGKAAALFQKIQPILELLRNGAAADYCEWGLGEPIMDTNLSHLGKVAELGRLARWSASYRFPSDPQGALDDLKAQARLGHHTADCVLGWLVQMGMESGALEVLRQNSGVLNEATLRRRRSFFDLPPSSRTWPAPLRRMRVCGIRRRKS